MRPEGHPIPVANPELHTVRDAMRRLNQLVHLLNAGELEKVVLLRGGQMCAVVLPLETYQRLVEAQW